MSDQIKSEIHIFKEIPRFPGETLLPGVPHTDAESVFNDPVAVKTTSLAADLSNPRLNSRSREGLVRGFATGIATNSDDIRRYRVYIAQLSESSDRPHFYSELVDRVKKFLPGSNEIDRQPSPILETKKGLPERSSLKIPQEAIVLTNACLYTAFPNEFGVSIPVLEEGDIRVVVNSSYAAYISRLESEIGHSYFREESAKASRPRLPDFAVMPMLPGKPVFYTESMLKAYKGLSQLTRDQLIANSLIHESMHRAARTDRIKVTTEEPLFTIALSSISNPIYLMPEGKAKEKEEAELDKLWEYIGRHDPEVEIEGGIMRLYCKDEDGSTRQITSSGYDFNEILVEIVGEKANHQLDSHIRKTQSSQRAAGLIADLRSDENSTTSMVLRKIGKKEAREYLATLGLRSDEAILTAYVNGRIPLLHVEKRPGENYFS